MIASGSTCGEASFSYHVPPYAVACSHYANNKEKVPVATLATGTFREIGEEESYASGRSNKIELRERQRPQAMICACGPISHAFSILFSDPSRTQNVRRLPQAIQTGMRALDV